MFFYYLNINYILILYINKNLLYNNTLDFYIYNYNHINNKKLHIFSKGDIMDILNICFSKTLYFKRIEFNLSQEKMSERCCISTRQYTDLENVRDFHLSKA